MRPKSIVIGAVAAAFLAAGTAAGAKTFRYSTSGDILGLDPYTNNEGPTNTMKSNLYEGPDPSGLGPCRCTPPSRPTGSRRAPPPGASTCARA